MTEERLEYIEGLYSPQSHPMVYELTAEVRRLREALEFYADPNGAGEDSNFCTLDRAELSDGAEPDEAEVLGVDIREVSAEGFCEPIGTLARAALEGK